MQTWYVLIKYLMGKPKNIRASDLAYEIIKKAILEHQFKAGEKLGKQAMAKLCGLSVIPVIDALNRLEGEGLVESNPYTGARVAAVDEEKFMDTFVFREAIEVQVVRILCFKMGLTELKLLYDMAQTIDVMVGQQDKVPIFDELHYQFHLELAKNAGSKKLIAELERLELFSLLVRAEQSYTSNLNKKHLPKENSHTDIITAIIKRDPEEAQRTMRRHIYRPIAEPPCWV
jgi:DNA-binding GntR family transcriptional regulator